MVRRCVRAWLWVTQVCLAFSQVFAAKGKSCFMYSWRVFSLLTEQKFAIKAALVLVVWLSSSSQIGLFFSPLSCKQPSSLCEPLLSQFDYFLQKAFNKYAIS